MKTVNEIRAFIKSIPTEVRSMTYEELVSVCNEHFPNIPILPLRFNNEQFFFGQYDLSGKNAIYQGRPITNKKNQPHSKISEISFIPVDKQIDLIKEFGRANKKGESMFYGAIHYSTACMEALNKGIDFINFGSGMVSVGTWLIVEPLKIAQLPLSKKYWSLLDEITTFELVNNSNQKINEEISSIKKLVKNEIDYEILELFADAFANFKIECEQDYYLSNYYKDRIFDKVDGFKPLQEFDAIIYSSVSNSYESDNIVIKPDAVTTKMKFMDALQVWVLHNKEPSQNVQFIPIKQRVYADEEGNIKWH